MWIWQFPTYICIKKNRKSQSQTQAKSGGLKKDNINSNELRGKREIKQHEALS